ncbi:hypothetical protein D3C80_1468980 [compost metagenome]
MGLMNQSRQRRELRRAYAHPGEIQTDAAFIQQTHHHPLAVIGRKHGHPHIDGPAANLQRDTAILRDALLGNVQFGHHLNARCQQGRQLMLGSQNGFQHPINTKADHQFAVIGLDMNI